MIDGNRDQHLAAPLLVVAAGRSADDPASRHNAAPVAGERSAVESFWAAQDA